MDKARFLLYDIETSPLITYAWQIYDADAVKVIKDTQILCFAYKWLGDKSVKVLGQDDLKGYKKGINNDKKLVEALWRLFDEAHVVVAHNGNSFDQKVVQARMMAHKLYPPSPYKQIDTRNVARRYARFTSNRLNDLGKTLSLGQKLSTGGFELWEGCLAGDKAAWAKIKRYNKQDVVLLEQLYYHLRPWMDNHPALNLMSDRPESCPKCGKGPMVSKGYKFTKVGKRHQFQCRNCGGWMTARQSEKELVKVSYVN